ncbi:MAG: DNA recombination protein RmuC [Gammaproteobacteria bacterium]|nr:DNA recombination protein RmuC [Gammaproteobacteria bacterium]|tara:strand:- start:75562 stop:76836 length:1275 start_codon:yes stop_codon:yes gene_type:complete
MPASQPVILLLTLLLILSIAGLVLLYRRNQQLQSNLDQERNAATELKVALGRQETQLQEERNQHQQRLQTLEDARKQMTAEFKNLANDILEQKSKAFTESNRENIENILKPLNEKIRTFEKKVEETYDKESKQRFLLQEQIKTLQEANIQISQETLNLTNALKGESKTQGIWGEFILERVLEKSGLVKGREYEVQVNLKTEDGKSRQPDVIVHLPENKDLIIDSKVSLSAYEKYCSEDEETQKSHHLKQHLASIRSHIKGLSDKNYQNIEAVRNLDFVMMFLPIEAAFTLAVQHDEKLFTDAFEKNIVIVCPSTLLATLRTIQNIWRYEQQNTNAQEIAQSAGKLYDKFVLFMQSLDEIGSNLNKTQKAYDEAYNRIYTGHGNLVKRVQQLQDLGARTSKSIPDRLLDNERLEDDSDNDGEAGA